MNTAHHAHLGVETYDPEGRDGCPRDTSSEEAEQVALLEEMATEEVPEVAPH